MKAEVISVGTEILIGAILNTNQQYLSRTCVGLGIDVYRHSTVGDNPQRLASALVEALTRSDLVMTTGGLGPTADDITLKTVADTLGLELVRHKPTYRAILKLLENKRSKMSPAVKAQALVPKGARVFPNHYGTAPGILLSINREKGTKYVLLLPGPPLEMNPMFSKYVRPVLSRLASSRRNVLLTRSLKFFMIPEAEIASKIDDLLRMKPPLTMGIYARQGEIELRIMSKDKTQRAALKGIRRIEKKVRARFPHEHILEDQEGLEDRLAFQLRRAKKTLALAESCTGGLLAHMITNVPGSSDFLAGSVVAYHNRIKTELVEVPSSLILAHGAVSAEVGRAMAVGVRDKFGTDYGVAITGIAGPSGGTKKKPVGLVYVAVSGSTREVCRRFYFVGTREVIKLKAAKAALKLLIDILSGKSPEKDQCGLQNQVRV